MKPCEVCGRPCSTYQATLCPRCMMLRGSGAAKGPRTEALRRAWNQELGAFLCHYSGVVLTEDPSSPWRLAFHPQTPGDWTELVVCARLIEQFKSSFTEPEFRRLVLQLGERFTGVRARIETFTPAHWGPVKPFRRA